MLTSTAARTPYARNALQARAPHRRARATW